MQRASLAAGVVILLVGIGALAFVRPWGLRLPRWLVIVPALAGGGNARPDGRHGRPASRVSSGA